MGIIGRSEKVKSRHIKRMWPKVGTDLTERLDSNLYYTIELPVYEHPFGLVYMIDKCFSVFSSIELYIRQIYPVKNNLKISS